MRTLPSRPFPSPIPLTLSSARSAHPTSNVEIKVVCGESQGSESEGLVKGNVRPLGGCWFMDFIISKKGERVFQQLPSGWNAFVRPLLYRLLSHTDDRCAGLHPRRRDAHRSLRLPPPSQARRTIPHRSPLQLGLGKRRLVRIGERQGAIRPRCGRAVEAGGRAAWSLCCDVARGHPEGVLGLPDAEERV